MPAHPIAGVATEDERLWLNLFSELNEVQRRRFAALKALELKWGGVSRVCELTGMSHHTVEKGRDELKSKDTSVPGRLRKMGGGRKRIIDKDPRIKGDIERILDETTAGNPMSRLRWVNKSTYAIADELGSRGANVSEDTVRRILKLQGYTLQANRKSVEGASPPERDAQFRYINAQATGFLRKKQPVISVDTKKKELVGDFKNAGRTWRRKRNPREVNVHDFPDLGKGKAVPYGAYDVALNKGFVNVGVSSDTAEFAVESIRQWWKQLGRACYPRAKELLICADSGGSNSSRSRCWKRFLQDFSDETRLKITVLHFPPGTSKWNKIEHRLFSFISMNWKGCPLTDYQVVVNLIKGTRTATGLEVFARLDTNRYAKGLKVSDEEMASLRIRRHSLHPLWNYTIGPRR